MMNLNLNYDTSKLKNCDSIHTSYSTCQSWQDVVQGQGIEGQIRHVIFEPCVFRAVYKNYFLACFLENFTVLLRSVILYIYT